MKGMGAHPTIENKRRWSFFQFDKQQPNQPSRVILISEESMLEQRSNYSIHPLLAQKL